ncbi:hypothetical protein E6W39_35155 [Kitasatospora acidiphila]|uniref:Uncharacterized protein n=1 Tax=Kitasatospora acidiphila TaxID=2567942 RepID=A0A540WBZ9_9ACTN|nr:hypothetical protein [Kitasatospora acidiphila]TQF06478.1 hypothetical protein E6W39_35155 [Kitasatospora acidiphila]
MSVLETYDFVVPGEGDQEAVRHLVATSEASKSSGPGSAQGAALLLLAGALLLEAGPRKEEPIEDAYVGMVQNLACAAAF